MYIYISDPTTVQAQAQAQKERDEWTLSPPQQTLFFFFITLKPGVE